MPSRFEPTEGNQVPDGVDADVIDEVVALNGETVYVAHHDVRKDGLTVTLSLALAAVSGRPATELIPTFSRYVDPDALDRLFRPLPNGDRREGGPLHLHVDGHDVDVHSSGRIEIYG